LEMPDPVRPTYVHVHFTPTGVFYLLAIEVEHETLN